LTLAQRRLAVAADPLTGRWTSCHRLDSFNPVHASVLPDGSVLLMAGSGNNPADYDPFYGLRTSYEYDCVHRQFIKVASMAGGRWVPRRHRTGFRRRVRELGRHDPEKRAGASPHEHHAPGRRGRGRFTLTRSGSGWSLTTSANLTPPGYYHLVAVDSRGVPSVAKVVKVT
jgi:Galactose oxidase-like, Early set domain